MNLPIADIVFRADPEFKNAIQNRLDDLTKPKGSLGRLEEFVMQYCLCKNSISPVLDTMQLYTFASDHGITNQHVCPYPRSVTCQMVENMLRGGAAISVLCRNAGIESFVVDIGTDGDFGDDQHLIQKKVARGTADFSLQAAMTREQCELAIKTGYDLGLQAGADLLGIGEMGIGNSSSASALYALLMDIDSDLCVGAGTGSSGEMLCHKRKIIKEAVGMHRGEWDLSPFDALRRVGGFEIAGMCGMIIGGAVSRKPVVVDGFIAGAAAMVAICMNPSIKEFLFFSHCSAEQFHSAFLHQNGIRPILDLDMRLGEGTGAALAMQIIAQALNCFNHMATFSEAVVDGPECVEKVC